MKKGGYDLTPYLNHHCVKFDAYKLFGNGDKTFLFYNVMIPNDQRDT